MKTPNVFMTKVSRMIDKLKNKIKEKI